MSTDLVMLQAIATRDVSSLLYVQQVSVYERPGGPFIVEIDGFIPVTPERFEDPSDTGLLLRDYVRVYADLLAVVENSGWVHYAFPRLEFDGEALLQWGGPSRLRRIEARVRLEIFRW